MLKYVLGSLALVSALVFAPADANAGCYRANVVVQQVVASPIVYQSYVAPQAVVAQVVAPVYQAQVQAVVSPVYSQAVVVQNVVAHNYGYAHAQNIVVQHQNVVQNNGGILGAVGNLARGIVNGVFGGGGRR